MAGDRVRRLVQRPPRLPGPRLRPLRRARGRGRQRATSRSTSRGCSRSPRRSSAPTDTTDAAIEAILGSGIARDRDARPPRARAGRVHDPGAEGARRARRRRRDRRPGRPRARPGERGVRSRTDTTARRNVEVLREYAAREPSGKPKTPPPPLLRLAGRDPRRRRRSRRSRSSATTLVADESGRVRAVATDEREVHPVRPRPAQRRLPRRRRCRACPFDERRGTIPNDGGRVARRRPARPIAGALLRRLDQARPERRDRHEQEGRDRDRRAPARGRRERAARAAGDRRPERVLELLAERGVEVVDLRRLGGDRRARVRPRRSAGPARASSSAPGTSCSPPPAASPARLTAYHSSGGHGRPVGRPTQWLMESMTVECLRCGETHRLGHGPWRQLQSGECPRCGYLGWAPTASLSELERRALRDRPLERRRLHAVA